MKFFQAGLTVACALVVCANEIGLSQSPEQPPSDAVRVTVSMHPDGSRTVYKFDNVQHKAVATTTDPDGKLRETIRWMMRGTFPAAKFPDPMAAFVSRAATSTMMPAIFWKRLKAPKMARYYIRLFTVTTHRANRPAIQCSTHPAN